MQVIDPKKLFSLELNDFGMLCKFFPSNTDNFCAVVADNNGTIYFKDFYKAVIANLNNDESNKVLKV